MKKIYNWLHIPEEDAFFMLEIKGSLGRKINSSREFFRGTHLFPAKENSKDKPDLDSSKFNLAKLFNNTIHEKVVKDGYKINIPKSLSNKKIKK